MPRSYRVGREDELLDDICHRELGSVGGVREVYELNRQVLFEGRKVHLSSFDLFLPAGIEILLPDQVETTAPVERVSLWD